MNIPVGPEPFFLVHWLGNFQTWLVTSDFFAALFGAGVGAYSAHHLAEKTKRRNELLKEIRATNASSSAAAAIAMTLIGIHKDIIGPIIKTFEEQQQRFANYLEQKKTNPVAVFDPRLEGTKFTLPKMPEEILQQQVFEKLSIVGRPLLLTSMLVQALHQLRLQLELRNKFIESLGDGPRQILAEHYFGFELNGMVNEVHSSPMRHIKRQLKNAIFFSTLLCRDITAYGKLIADRYEDLSYGDAPKVYKAKFDTPGIEGIVPPDIDYPTWFNNVKTEQLLEPLGRIARLRASIRRKWKSLQIEASEKL